MTYNQAIKKFYGFAQCLAKKKNLTQILYNILIFLKNMYWIIFKRKINDIKICTLDILLLICFLGHWC